jgi:hypothetical protein
MTGSTAQAAPMAIPDAMVNLPPMPAATAGLVAIVERVAAILDAETEALGHGVPLDIAEFNHRKRHALLELTRGLRAFGDPGPPVPGQHAQGPHEALRDCLGGFAAKLERNRRALDTRLRAVREIADIIAQTIRESESDGTYSLLAARQ